MRNTNDIKIHLIRHGKTPANEQKLYCGATDLPLSDAGIIELVELKEKGIYPKCADFYFTSGLMRTEQTLDLLYGSVPRVAIPQLAEFNFGSFEMKSYEMLKEQDDYQAWITDEAGGVSCPGGENRQDFTRRVLQGFEMLTEKWQGDLFVVCHGGVIVSIMAHLFPNTKNFYEWQPQPGRGYSIVPDGLKLYQPI
ncbi:MAG: histidine phosphatase family protein [Defluviitaleaceae bacterium]|nr:histidine phosphatase family protein [Defluviitaleaceae bacterium]MCL2238968.1 histidine phosphatase family protein [Defluviitaleaceae bacterium]